MIKQLLSVLAVASVVTVNAQSSRGTKNLVATGAIPAEQSITYKTNAPVTTLTLNPLTGTNVTVYTWGADTTVSGCDPNAGYIFGSNCYGDKEKAQFFAASGYTGTVSQASVTAASVLFFKDGTMGTGGAPTTTVGLKVYNGTSNTSAPGTLLGSAVASMSNILAAQSGTNPFFAYTFTFTAPASITAGFYVSVVIPTTAGDTAVVANETAAVNNTWDKWSDNSWNSLSMFGVKANMAIFPEITGNQVTTGLSSSALNSNIVILPNPSNGAVYVNVAFTKPENISLNVTNALGQQIYTNRYDNITNSVLPLNLTDQPNGVYFITVSNGAEKMVKRIVVNK